MRLVASASLSSLLAASVRTIRKKMEGSPSSPSRDCSAHGRFLWWTCELAERLGNLSGKLGLMNKTGRNHRHTPILARPDRGLESVLARRRNCHPGHALTPRLCGFSIRPTTRRDAEERDIFSGFGCLCFAGALEAIEVPLQQLNAKARSERDRRPVARLRGRAELRPPVRRSELARVSPQRPA